MIFSNAHTSYKTDQSETDIIPYGCLWWEPLRGGRIDRVVWTHTILQFNLTGTTAHPHLWFSSTHQPSLAKHTHFGPSSPSLDVPSLHIQYPDTRIDADFSPPLRTIWTPCLQRTENDPETLESCFKVGRSFCRWPFQVLRSFQGFGVPCNSLVAASSTNLNPFDPETARAPALPHKHVPSAPPASSTLKCWLLTHPHYYTLPGKPTSQAHAYCANPSALEPDIGINSLVQAQTLLLHNFNKTQSPHAPWAKFETTYHNLSRSLGSIDTVLKSWRFSIYQRGSLC